MYASFHSIFPKIAKQETRFITVPENGKVPQGDYGYFPSFCTDKDCDCRRTLINVLQVNPDYPDTHAATISYGWEKMGFYKEWGGGLPLDVLNDFKGPSLEVMQQQSSYANYFLEIFQNILSTDEEYANRIQRHYAYIKMKQMKKLPKELNQLIDYFGQCPCESGKTFRQCCGKKRRLSR